MKPVILAYFVWAVGLISVWMIVAPHVPLRQGYLGVLPWANFDGVHYLRIARDGYFQFGEAFFPLYPGVLRLLNTVVPFVPLAFIGITVSLASFLVALILLYQNERKNDPVGAGNLLILYLTFPTAFFFACVYTEGLFLGLSVLSIVLIRKHAWALAALSIAAASATRLVGVLLLIPFTFTYVSYVKRVRMSDIVYLLIGSSGLVSYMTYLFMTKGDALLFFHVQSAFGAGRSSGELILLPQVFWRYARILFTAYLQPTPVSYIVSISELAVTVLAVLLIWYAWKRKFDSGLLLYSAVSLLIPSLTGTLSSMPRYVLAAFPLFVFAARNLNRRYAVLIGSASAVIEAVAVSYFLRGWFIA